jgi:tetratricopeptide (TPR) repeat protein
MMEIPEDITLAKQQLKSGQLKLAEESSKRILQADADQPEALHLLGIIYHKTGRSDIAVELVTRAIAINSHIPEYHYNLGIIYSTLGKTDDAIRAYQACLNLKPDHTDALNNLGLVLYEQNRFEESIILFQQSICAKPELTNAWYNLGMALQAQGQPEEAIEAYNQVIKIFPDSAEAHFNRSIALLLTENFEEGWVEYEWRFRSFEKKKDAEQKKSLMHWDGSSLIKRRILVNDEQGIGDTFQFIRYLSMLKELGGFVFFETSKPLSGLLEKFAGIDELVEPSPVGFSQNEFDSFVPLMSLPGIFNTTLETIPGTTPYLFASHKKVEIWQDRIDQHMFNVGIVWAGNPTTKYEQAGLSGLEHVNLAWAGNPSNKIAAGRSNRLEFFKPLAEFEGVQLYGLQKGAAAGQVEDLSNSINVINLGEEFEDFSDTAGVIDNLDLIITVDTSVAHLAGAMGKPVWVLIPYVPDWRWMIEREDSPWYPTMRLFRQQTKGNWNHVFERVASELGALVSQ